MPLFPPDQLVASAVSEDVSFVHRPTSTDDLSEVADAHVRMTPGQQLFYLIIAWDNNGDWDYVWTTAGAAPTKPPERCYQAAAGARLRSGMPG